MRVESCVCVQLSIAVMWKMIVFQRTSRKKSFNIDQLIGISNEMNLRKKKVVQAEVSKVYDIIKLPLSFQLIGNKL